MAKSAADGGFSRPAVLKARKWTPVTQHGFAVAYLDPPPFPAPVVVLKDVGGYVSEYQAQTARFRQEGREVRLHECRSACTLALSLPNVCVYPGSLLKFHKAYNANTRAVDETVSQELFRSYPAAVQARLGGLTREYKVLTGRELIALGMRNCEGDGVQVARAGKQPPTPAAVAPAERSLLSTLSAAFSPNAVDLKPEGTLRASRVKTAAGPWPEPEMEDIPLPPRRPADIDPMPGPGLPRLITGAQQALASGLKATTGLFSFYRLD